MVANKLDSGTWWNLWSFLSAHEEDIATDINDYGDLKRVFLKVVGRRPTYPRNSE